MMPDIKYAQMKALCSLNNARNAVSERERLLTDYAIYRHFRGKVIQEFESFEVTPAYIAVNCFCCMADFIDKLDEQSKQDMLNGCGGYSARCLVDRATAVLKRTLHDRISYIKSDEFVINKRGTKRISGAGFLEVKVSAIVNGFESEPISIIARYTDMIASVCESVAVAAFYLSKFVLTGGKSIGLELLNLNVLDECEKMYTKFDCVGFMKKNKR